jgi:hypothetical protein
MKWIKKYENFVTDNNRDTAAIDFLPKHNPVVKQQATEYVDDKLKSNDFADMFKVVGMEPPKDLKSEEMDSLFDEVREKAIEYFVENPEAIGKDIKFSSMANSDKQNLSNQNDRVPTTNNVGGTSQTASSRIGESKTNFDSEIEITEDDMNKFNSEEPLVELIRNSKISLGNKKVSFNKSDKETIEVLDIYFEFDQKDLESDIEETKE